jgi:D-alanyl-D-alanine carboxypeptidase (penicillin-binding protein 5/6)
VRNRYFFLLTCCLSFVFSQGSVAAAQPEVFAKSAIVIEASTGKILYEKNSQERRYPASTTKIMTLLVALEAGNLSDIVTTSGRAANTEGSSLSLVAGEQLSLLNMLYGMMLVSGNDATVAVAEHIAGSVENYAQLMTNKAHEIGAWNTNFTNSSGLPDPRHYTTAADLAKIAAYGYSNPNFVKIVGTSYINMPWPGKGHDRSIINENKLLWQYDGCNGVKTGYTDAAGRCLVSGANRNGIQLIVVVLDSERMWEDSIKLLDYGFSLLKPQLLIAKGELVETVGINNGTIDAIPLVANSNMVAPVSFDDRDQFITKLIVPGRIEAPVQKGQKVGEVKTYYNNREISSVALIAAESAPRKSLFALLWSTLWEMIKYMLQRVYG